MTIAETIRTLTLLKEHAKESLEAEGEEMGFCAISGKDIEALTMAATALEGIRILDGIFSKEAGA